MRTSRLEAFSDGVLAIVITIMVLELKVPDGTTLHALWETTGRSLLSYVLSFVYVGIYWNNHHHMLQITRRVTGASLWANLAMLFWLSLLPFTTAWIDESNHARTPVVVYGVDLLAAGAAYYLLQRLLVRAEGEGSALARAVGNDVKGKASILLYLLGIACALAGPPRLGLAVFTVVAVMWVVPDRRLERAAVAACESGAE